MTRGSRRPQTSPAQTSPAPGRPHGRPRTTTRVRTPDVQTPDEAQSPQTPADEAPPPSAPESRGLRIKGLRVTRRALALVIVLVVLALSYASTLRVYINQQHDLAVTEQLIRDQRAQVADVRSQLAQWNDPVFVTTQARQRLGWVMPGETGYRVVDDDGQPIDGGAIIDSERVLPPEETLDTWWERMWGSVAAADAPAPKK